MESPVNQPIRRSPKSEAKNFCLTLPTIDLGQQSSLNRGRGYWQEKTKSAGVFLESMESDTYLFIFNSKILIYIASMLAFREVFQNALEKNKVHERLGAVPTIIVDGLLSRFAEMARGSSRYFQRCPDFIRSCIDFCKVPADISDENKSSHSYIRIMSQGGQLCYRHSTNCPRLEYASPRVSLLNCYLSVFI